MPKDCKLKKMFKLFSTVCTVNMLILSHFLGLQMLLITKIGLVLNVNKLENRVNVGKQMPNCCKLKNIYSSDFQPYGHTSSPPRGFACKYYIFP